MNQSIAIPSIARAMSEGGAVDLVVILLMEELIISGTLTATSNML